jgi:hypothetical protein
MKHDPSMNSRIFQRIITSSRNWTCCCSIRVRYIWRTGHVNILFSGDDADAKPTLASIPEKPCEENDNRAMAYFIESFLAGTATKGISSKDASNSRNIRDPPAYILLSGTTTIARRFTWAQKDFRWFTDTYINSLISIIYKGVRRQLTKEGFLPADDVRLSPDIRRLLTRCNFTTSVIPGSSKSLRKILEHQTLDDYNVETSEEQLNLDFASYCSAGVTAGEFQIVNPLVPTIYEIIVNGFLRNCYPHLPNIEMYDKRIERSSLAEIIRTKLENIRKPLKRNNILNL